MIYYENLSYIYRGENVVLARDKDCCKVISQRRALHGVA